MADFEELITEHIDVWTSAVKRQSSAGRGGSKKLELYGVKKLRALILDLAVRGLLVPQDSSDEPASVLFDQISDEKADLVKKKIIKEKKDTSPTDDIKAPFNLPSGWGWRKLGSIGVVTSSSRVHQRDWTVRGVPFYRAREIVKLSKNESIQNALFISEEKFKELSHNGTVPSPMDIMITGVGTIGIPYVVKQHDHFYFKDASVLIFKNYHKLNPDYLSKVMMSPYWIKKVHEGSMGTTVHTFTIQRANTVDIPIAPIEEQHRIVAKVDELMALCDQLEQQTESSITAHQTLVETLLGALTQSTSTSPSSSAQLDSNEAAAQDTFEQAWQRIAEHFDTLFTTEQSVELLKQSILQLAVMGKLVPQDPDDEPASELLKRIAVEKAELVAAKVIKKQKALPEIGEAEKPFELPVGWERCRLGNIGYDLGGGTPSKSKQEFWNGTIPWVSPKEMKFDYIEKAQDNITEKAVQETTVKYIPKNSLLLVVRGMILAHSFPVAINLCEIVINQDMKALVFNNLLPSFVLLQVKSKKSDVVRLVDRSSHGTCKLVSEKLWNIIITIPPIKEQHRIVGKVDELMTLCDQLKIRLAEAQNTQLQLADSVTEQTVN